MAKWMTTGITVYDFISAPGERFKAAFVKPSFMTTLDVGLLQQVINQLGSLREMATLVNPNSNLSEQLTAIATYITAWSTERKPMFERIHDLYSAQYNPLENFDRYEASSDVSASQASAETMTESGSHSVGASASANTTSVSSDASSNTDSISSTSASTDTMGNTDGTTASKTGSKIMPIDGSTEADMQTTGGGDASGKNESASTSASQSDSVTDSNTTGTQKSKADTVAETSENNDTSEHASTSAASKNTTDNTMEHVGHLHGNIGVTTSQQMLEAENKLRRAYGSDIRYIAECFLADCTLMAWNF